MPGRTDSSDGPRLRRFSRLNRAHFRSRRGAYIARRAPLPNGKSISIKRIWSAGCRSSSNQACPHATGETAWRDYSMSVLGLHRPHGIPESGNSDNIIVAQFLDV